VGWSNPPIPWSEFERKLSQASRPGSAPPLDADGGDSPAWSRKRTAYVPPSSADAAADAHAAIVPYAELHAHSSFSFLDGASMPEKLAEEAARLGLTALALTDHDGLYGIVRMAEAALPQFSVPSCRSG
jgi:error-prone DNA polymerase